MGTRKRVEVLDGLVIRRKSPWSASVQSFLEFVDDRVPGLVPTPEGFDAESEFLRFVPGEVCSSPRPAWARSPQFLTQTGHRLAVLHGLGREFLARNQTSEWFPHCCSFPVDTICHNDLVLTNVVWNNDSATFIDWEMASPGNSLTDLVCLAWHSVPLYSLSDLNSEGFVSASFDTIERLTLLCEGYGLSLSPKFVSSLLGALDRHICSTIELTKLAHETDLVYLDNWREIDIGVFSSDLSYLRNCRVAIRAADDPSLSMIEEIMFQTRNRFSSVSKREDVRGSP